MILANRTHIRISLSRVRRTVQKILQVLSISGADLDITFVGDHAIRTLNQKFRKIDRPTDVLSFPLLKPKEARRGKSFLGDLVISLPTVKRQAKEYRKTLASLENSGRAANSKSLRSIMEAELYFLMVHGILHLLGYDHEKSESQARVMRRLENKILRKL